MQHGFLREDAKIGYRQSLEADRTGKAWLQAHLRVDSRGDLTIDGQPMDGGVLYMENGDQLVHWRGSSVPVLLRTGQVADVEIRDDLVSIPISLAMELLLFTDGELCIIDPERPGICGRLRFSTRYDQCRVFGLIAQLSRGETLYGVSDYVDQLVASADNRYLYPVLPFARRDWFTRDKQLGVHLVRYAANIDGIIVESTNSSIFWAYMTALRDRKTLYVVLTHQNLKIDCDHANSRPPRRPRKRRPGLLRVAAAGGASNHNFSYLT